MSHLARRLDVTEKNTNTLLRETYLRNAKRIVLKVGSSLLAESPIGQPAAIADEIAKLSSAGLEVVIVSSGAIAMGLPALGLKNRPAELPLLQAAAAIGQNRLLQNWEHAFSVHRRHIAQILLTNDGLNIRHRFQNASNALQALLEAKIIPIINENDTVATDEITFGDNDELAALVCNLVQADALLIYTDVNGLHDASPSEGGVRIPVVTDIDAQARPAASSDSGSGLGRGGMASKVLSAERAACFGVPTLVLPGSERFVLQRSLNCEDIGTLFVPQGVKGPRKQILPTNKT